MEKMDLTLSGPQLYQPAHNTLQQRRYLIAVVLVSALLHAVVIALLAFPVPPEPVVNQAPVKAILYMPEPAEVLTEPQVEPPPAEPADDTVTEPPPSVVTETPSTATETMAEPSPDVTAPTEQEPDQYEAQATDVEPSSGEILTQAENSPAPNSRSIARSVAAAVANQQQELLNNLGAERARQRREEIASPDLRIGEYVPPEPVVGEYKINCEKGINSKLAIVAGLLGGNVKCNQRNEFQQFIDKRQHKPKQ
ncbi:MAG: hypothetical protein HWE26_12125 [Alteromonadaceae bacterium]|nr:hypothetical protein [Alteromonadaceae bacterium]